MKNVTFADQSIPMPDEFRAAVSKAARNYFPKKRELGDVDTFMANHVDAVEAAISGGFPECRVSAEAVPDEMTFTIDLGVGDTGWARITLPITFESGTVFIGGVR